MVRAYTLAISVPAPEAFRTSNADRTDMGEITMSTTAVEPYKAGVFDLTHKLTVEKHGHTALITINHPPANTWDRESLIGLKQVVEHLNHDDEVYALVISGQGESSSAQGPI